MLQREIKVKHWNPIRPRIVHFVLILIALALGSVPAFGATRHKPKRHNTGAHKSRKPLVKAHHPVSHVSRLHRKRFIRNPCTEPTFADSTVGDSVYGEDLAVRRAAVQALAPYNGSVVAADPQTRTVLTLGN